MMHAEIVAAEPAEADKPVSRRTLALLLVGCWIAASLILVAVNWTDIATLSYPDPDDQLRLVEVRDWLFGQSWWDVSQHRIDAPFGGGMHWSRYVDLPIALVIVALKPFLGYAAAQTGAAILVPLLTLGATMAGSALLARRLLDREAAILAALLVCATPGALAQMRPMRVDHHGWQIALAIAALVALLQARPLRSGLAAGAIVALWLRISLEGLPLAAAMAVLVGLRWAFAYDRSEDARFAGFFGALAAGSLLLFGGAIPASQWPLAWCDMVSAPHLEMLATGALGALALVRLPARPLVRLAGGAALGLACIAVYHLGAPRCGLDPFADIDPIVRKVWLHSIREGLPIWNQTPLIATLVVGYPLVALLGGALAWRQATGEHRTLWACYLFVLLAATVAGVLVQRAGGTANALALPGGLFLLLGGLRRARAQTATAKRLLGTAAAVILFAPVTPGMTVMMLTPENEDAALTNAMKHACATVPNVRSLNALAPANTLTQLDLSPAVLLETHHGVLATGHHRNHRLIADELRAFIGDEALAHRILRAHRIRYVVLCPDTVEMGVYAHIGPHGFASMLRRGALPAWLRPVTVPGNAGLGVWQVVG